MFRPSVSTGQRGSRTQRGFGLGSVMLGIAIGTLLAVLASVELAQRVNDAAAEATGRYLLAVRDALIAFQLRHEAWLNGQETTNAAPGVYPPAPPLNWQAGAGGVQLAHGTVALLKQQGLLPEGQPDFTPLGEQAQFTLVRHGDCPGAACMVQSYVYTCHPVSAQNSTKTQASCLTPQGRRAEYDATLLGQVMLATQGYGAHDALTPGHFSGPLAHADKAWFPLSGHNGHALVVASLGATPFPQFVRMGDTRPVHLHNTLTVGGAIQTDTGLLLNTQAVLGSACPTAHMLAATSDDILAVCQSGVWAASAGRTVQGVYMNLVHGAYVAPPVCQAPAAPFRYVSLSAVDILVTGAQLDVHGDVGGQLDGSGAVNAAGSVALSGTFSGSFQSAPSSSLRVSQSASLDAAHRIQIQPPGASARASVIQGCLH